MKKLTQKTPTCLSVVFNRKLSALSIFIISPLFMLAQLGGIWYGELENDSTHKKQNFEIGLSEYRGKITGFTYTTFIENDTFYYSVKRIKAEKKDGLLIVTDDEMVSNNFPERAAKGVKQTTVFPLINDSTFDITKGTWSTNRTKRYYALNGSAQVQEVEDRRQSDLVAHLEEMKVKNDIVTRTEQRNAAKPIAVTTIPPKKEEKKQSPPKQGNAEQPNTTETVLNKPVTKKDEIPATQPIASENRTITEPTNVKVTQQPVNTNTASLNQQPANTAPSVQQRAIVPTQQAVQQSQSAAGRSNNSSPEKIDQQQLATNSRLSVSSAMTSPVQNNARTVKQNTQPQVQSAQTREPIVVKNDKPATEKITPATPSPATPKEILVAKALPTVVATRANETIQKLYFHSDSLVLSLYDNGVVDGDTVSVFLNGNAVISKQQLKVSAFKKTIYITPDMDSVQLVLFADNLGSIPPNTGLLTVRDGEQTYNVRFSADLQKNAAIVLSRKK